MAAAASAPSAPPITAILDGPLPLERCSPAPVIAPGRGAVASFLGVVRDHHRGRGVALLDYACYRSMAEKVLARLAAETAKRFGDDLAVMALHGVGVIRPGEVALCLHAASAHRVAACDGVRWLLEAIKRELPVWKHQRFTDGTTEWVHGS